MKAFKIAFIVFILAMNVFNLMHTRYKNIGEVGDPPFFKLLEWKFTREKPKWPELPKDRPNFIKPNIPNKTTGDDILVAYVNHSTLLIQIGDENILTDPVWSTYAGPFGMFGVKRSIYPGIEIDELPNIDFILISHSHYDHLDLPTLEVLTKKYEPTIITGLGVTKYIDYCQQKASRCFELEWWENVKIADSEVKFHFVPAYHWSSRFLLDKDISLWGGFIIEKEEDRIYFAGDTAFSDGKIFEDIKEKYGDIKLSLLPIGAYKPNWFFSSMHTSPAEAVKISKILNSKYSIPIHYDTFELSDEKYEDPLSDLKIAIDDQKPSTEFVIMQAGTIWKLPHN